MGPESRNGQDRFHIHGCQDVPGFEAVALGQKARDMWICGRACGHGPLAWFLDDMILVYVSFDYM